MLTVIKSMKELSFSALMAVYEESNLHSGRNQHPFESQWRQIALAEQDFYDYLRQCFFATPGAMYCVWVVDGAYVSACRLEPYQDGFLLTALETAPGQRGKGYATALIQAIEHRMKETAIYSHISSDNRASMKVHERCGFRKISDHAAYLDGSVSRSAATFLKKN